MIKEYIFKNKKSLIISLIASWFAICFFSIASLDLSNITRLMLDGEFIESTYYIGISISFFLIYLLCMYISQKYANDFTINISDDIRVDYMKSLYKMKTSKYKFDTSYYINIIDKDVDQFRLNYLLNLVYSCMYLGQVLIFLFFW
ncbi:ABC transporter ATP-binding protein [Anaerococcus sp. WCA-380-WT-2B]|uniref:ABC transporter ATP-binding protein n=1 Tax=Anaerococcus porci TaxID=2652269 RepID=A0A6N7VC47_9FIRM|nr:hypothetical protein [Anaerococcus porci]MSS77018.1 ABC transporter ATP-binding protein [Anaerococcus porci]